MGLRCRPWCAPWVPGSIAGCSGGRPFYTIRPDGSGLTELTAYTAPGDRAVQPSWTPDGRSIISTKVVGTGFGEPTMPMIDADGSNVRPATGGEWRFGTHARLRPVSEP